MDRDDIIRMAQEAGLSLIYDERDEEGWQELERFAALVAAHEHLDGNARLALKG